MAKLYFKFGSMGSSKTANALMTKFNYEEKGKRVWIIKPATDTRDQAGRISSRIGLSSECDIIGQETDIYNMFKTGPIKTSDAVIADEAQFFSEEQIRQLRDIVSDFDIPVLCYGLRTDFQAKLFPGSKALFEFADSISEIKSICKCGAKSIINARFDSNGNIVTQGEQIDIGGNEKYEGLCYGCWKKLINTHS